MRGITITAESELVTETCCNCGMLFAMTTSFQKRRQQDHGGFYCPAGHIQYYLAESREQKLKRELDRAKQNAAYLEDQARIQRELREAAEKQASARKGVIARMKKRAAAGSCPCCQRTFSNMAEHMRKQHPGFVAEEVA